MGIIQDFLSGGSAEVAVRAALALPDFFRRDHLGRTLVLLHEEFGGEADLERSAVVGWRTDTDLAAAFSPALSGRTTPASEERLATLIKERLVRSSEDDRAELARRIAASAPAAARLAVTDLSEAVSLLGNQIEQSSRVVESLPGLLTGGDRGPDRPAEALVRGPLEHANARELIEEANRLATADPERAARVTLEACERLDASRLAAIAESYRERAAELLVEAQHQEEAAGILAAVVDARLDRGSELVRATIEQLRKVVPQEREWLASSRYARLSWPSDADGAADVLLDAARREDVDAALVAHCATFLTFLERHEDVIQITERWRDGALATGARCEIEIAALEAAEALGRPGADEAWSRLLDWAEANWGNPDAAIVWQRRGLQLALADRVDEAVEAYRNAMRLWTRVDGADEQLGDAFYCIQAVSLNAARDPVDYNLWPLAAELRGSGDLPVARAEHLDHRAMQQRLDGRLRQAWHSYSRALLVHRRSGSLQGMLSVHQRLGELMEQAGEPLEALQHYIWAGKGKEAKRPARKCEFGGVEEALTLTGPAWQRAVAYEVINEVGEELSTAFATRHAATMRRDAAARPSGWRGPDVRSAARRALFAVSLQLEDEDRDAALEAMREDLVQSWPANREAASRAMALGTDLGLWDETETLLEVFLIDPSMSGVSAEWVATRAVDSPAVVERLRAAVVDGNDHALEALAVAERLEPRALFDAQALRDAATGYVARSRELRSVRHIDRPDGTSEVSVGLGGSLVELGLIGGFADEEARTALLERLIDVVGEAEEPELHRASAVAALGQLAAGLGNRAIEMVEWARPLAFGDYPASPWDEDRDHPLSAIRFSRHQPGALRAQAIMLIARVRELHPGIALEWYARMVREALGDSSHLVNAAGLAAAERASATEYLVHIEPHFQHERPAVRTAAISAWASSGRELPSGGSQLVRDSAPRVRMALVNSVSFLPDPQRRELLDQLQDDRDCYIRTKARDLGGQRGSANGASA
jgi:hypothetical protein